ncbi:M3 family metallopeptidase, partial [bacterium]|nr:M3 family metallopeptidase [bacterium]
MNEKTNPETSTGSENPLLRTNGMTAFDEIRTEHVVPAMKSVIARAEKEIEELERSLEPTWKGLIEPLSELELPMEYAWGPVKHLMSVKNSDELRAAHDEMLAGVVNVRLTLKQSRPIYDGLKTLREGSDWDGLDEAQRRAVEIRLRDAEHAGVGLDGADRERFQEIEKELSKLATEFQNHVLDATKAFEMIITDAADTEGWPESLRQLAAQSYAQANEDAGDANPEAGPWRITLDFPSFGPFMQHTRNRSHREQIYRVYMTRASSGECDNTGIIDRELVLRKEKAKLLGFDTFAELSLSEKMAPDIAAVRRMFDELSGASKSYADADLGEIRKLAADSGFEGEFKHWDTAFWAERLREHRFDYTDDQLRPYFPMPRVLDGLFSLSERLFGIRIEAADGQSPVWNEDVRHFIVRGEDGEPVASFYLDAYSRPHEKRGGAWMNDFLSRRWIDGKLRLPVVFVTCNGTPPVGEKPSLMSFREVETLFHEFGHGLQAMLTTVDYADVAGLEGVEWDSVELASQFMENWCYNRPTLLGMTAHFETGEPLPDDLFDKIVAARTFRAGSLMMRQLQFGISDMRIHHEHDPDGSETPFDVHRQVSEETSSLPPFEGDRMLCAFMHIFTPAYAAGYYSYKWAEVLSADAFAA